MSVNLPRATQKIFAGDSRRDDVSVFGTMQNTAAGGQPTYSKDVEEIQSVNFTEGWDSAVLADSAPFMEDMNAVQYVLSSQLAYLFQKGLAEYDPNTTYFANNCFCQYEGQWYKSLTDNNVGNQPDISPQNWQLINFETTVDWGSIQGNLSNQKDLYNSLNFTRYAVNAGSTDEEGKPDYLEISGNSIVLKPYTVITDSTDTYNQTGGVIDLAEYEDGTYNIWFNKGQLIPSTKELLSSNITQSSTINATVVGSPAISNGIVSGFSTSNYLKLPQAFSPSNNPWEIVFKFTTGSNVNTYQYILGDKYSYPNKWGASLEIDTDGGLHFYATNGTNNPYIAIIAYTVSPNTTYKVKFKYTGSAYEGYIAEGGGDYTLINSVTSSTPITSSGQVPLIGVNYVEHNSAYQNPFLGSIDLKESYININGERWWSGASDSSNVVWQPPQEPLQRYIRQDETWVECEYVLLGSATVSNGAISNLTVQPFNENGFNVHKSNMGITVVETYKNGSSYYRLWSDGYCEQWGSLPTSTNYASFTINLLKPYKDISYNISVISSATSNYWYTPTLTTKTVNSFTCNYIINSANFATWYANGYIS